MAKYDHQIWKSRCRTTISARSEKAQQPKHGSDPVFKQFADAWLPVDLKGRQVVFPECLGDDRLLVSPEDTQIDFG